MEKWQVSALVLNVMTAKTLNVKKTALSCDAMGKLRAKGPVR